MSELIGKLHPLIIHLPIGILVLAFISEIASRTPRFSHLKNALPFIFMVAAVSAIISFLTGWIMPKEGEFAAELIGLHFWFSAGLTASSALLYLLYLKKQTKFGKFYFPVLLLTMGLLAATGHLGGSLTHGQHYFTISSKDEASLSITNVDSVMAFETIIQPIFEKRCVSCHNPGKQKGGLVMTTIEGLKNGGDEGAIFISGDPENSALIQRIHLPIEDEKHMPPEGKQQLSDPEITLIKWWISEGLDFEKKVGELTQTEAISSILKTYEQDQTDYYKDLSFVEHKTISKLAKLGVTITPLGPKNPMVIVTSKDTSLTSKTLKQLKPIAKNITELNLSSSNMNDELMEHLTDFTNLKTLKLQNTAITSKGLIHLQSLERLESLNLYGTNVNDTGLKTLNNIVHLNTLYLWQTKVTNQAIQGFLKNNPSIEINGGIDANAFGISQLRPPPIFAEQEIFKDTLRVSMDLNFKRAAILYTLDGTLPDSTSLKYDTPFLINKTTKVRAIVVKEGWITSEVSERVFLQTGYEIANLTSDKLPHESYKANGIKSLNDLEKGTTDFKDGKWLGFYGQDLTLTLDLGQVKAVNNTIVSALEDTGSYIFYPKSIAVSSSIDGRHFKVIGKLNIPIAQEQHPSELKNFLLNFEKTDVRYLKIHVSGVLKNPEWHPAPGGKSWVFLDEIIVN